MRRLVTTVVALLLVLTPAITVPAQTPAPRQQIQNKEQTVFITRTGRKYHRAGCSYLAYSRYPLSLKEAQQRGYGPCKAWHPPQ